MDPKIIPAQSAKGEERGDRERDPWLVKMGISVDVRDFLGYSGINIPRYMLKDKEYELRNELNYLHKRVCPHEPIEFWLYIYKNIGPNKFKMIPQ